MHASCTSTNPTLAEVVVQDMWCGVMSAAARTLSGDGGGRHFRQSGPLGVDEPSWNDPVDAPEREN